MEFDLELQRRKLHYVLEDNYSEFSVPSIQNVTNFVNGIVKSESSKVYIHPDCDVDGMLAAKIIQEMFDTIGYKNYFIPTLKEKSHNVCEDNLFDMINNGYTHVIILDSSTNDLELQRKLASNNIKTLIIDHHLMDYPDDEYGHALIVNCKSEEFRVAGRYLNSSSGMLAYFIAADIIKEFKCEPNTNIVYYAYITMHADVMDMSDRDNIGFSSYMFLIDSRASYPKLVELFRTPYYRMSKNFISFEFSNRINALARMNRYDVIAELVFKTDSLTALECKNLKDKVMAIANKSKEFLRELETSIVPITVGEFVVVNITDSWLDSSITTNIAANFTGLVANKLTDKYKRPCLAIIDLKDNTYKGSVRDCKNRRLIDAMSYAMKAEGHGSAFGVSFPKDSYNVVNRYLESITLDEVNVKPIELSATRMDITEFKRTCEKMALYNEFSGNFLPPASIIKKLEINNTISKGDKRIVIRYGDLEIVCFDKTVVQGNLIKVIPSLGVSKTKLIAEKYVSQ